jgi:hypothetical protein
MSAKYSASASWHGAVITTLIGFFRAPTGASVIVIGSFKSTCFSVRAISILPFLGTAYVSIV